jgi:hypothetical protein
VLHTDNYNQGHFCVLQREYGELGIELEQENLMFWPKSVL